MERVVNAMQQLADTPLDYNANLEIIAALRSIPSSQIDSLELRNARETMQSLFPLSYGTFEIFIYILLILTHIYNELELWSEWIADESNSAKSIEDKRYVLTLFENAVKDYLC